MVQQDSFTGRPGRVFGVRYGSAAPHAVKDIHANNSADWWSLRVFDGLHDAVQSAILVPYPSTDDIFSLGDEAEGEGAQPVHNLAALLAGAALNNAVVGNHGVLQTHDKLCRWDQDFHGKGY